MKIKFFTASLPSAAHPNENQDTFFIDEKNKAAGLFDGVGGLSHGVEAAISAAEFCKVQIPQSGLEKALKTCHLFIKEKGVKEFGREIAAVSVVCQVYSKQTPALVIWGSAGDCRIYHLSSEGLSQESLDDSLITQALENGWLDQSKAERINQATNLKGLNEIEKNLFKSRNVVTQALGIGVMKPRISKFKAKADDFIILTTDGVHGNLTNKEIENILKQKPPDPAKRLVEEATRVSESNSLRAKADDMTAVVIELRK
ncbi:MAG TPA: hypothetical protein VF303_01675 [Candidatus Nanoarchaeia archaeon]